MSNRTLLIVAAAVFALALGVIAHLVLNRQHPEVPPPQITGIYLAPAQPLPDFQLIQDSGEPLTAEDFKGRWSFLYFGFTHCPDVCPTSLAQLDALDQKLSSRGEDEGVDYWLISVDPARDTPQRLKAYTTHFNEDFRGATGTPEELDKLTGPIGIYYKARREGKEDQDYTVDHSSVFVLINPAGQAQALFTDLPGLTPQALAEDFQAIRDYYYRRIP